MPTADLNVQTQVLLAAEQHERRRRIAFIIDEAHLLAPDRLEELRLTHAVIWTTARGSLRCWPAAASLMHLCSGREDSTAHGLGRLGASDPDAPGPGLVHLSPESARRDRMGETGSALALEAMAARVTDRDGYFHNIEGHSAPQQPSWRLFAQILAASTMYE